MRVEIENHLKERLFHSLKKILWDSLQDLYDERGVSYAQLITAMRKAESESKQSKMEVVKAKSTVVSDEIAH